VKKILDAIKEQNNDYSNLENLYLERVGNSLTTNKKIKNVQTTPKGVLKVSVVISSWNVESSILSCLASIEKSSFNMKYQDKLEIIVIDDGSTDNTWSLIKKSTFSLNLKVSRQKHRSISHARNLGINLSNGDIIIFCDADMILSLQTIENFEIRHRELSNVLLVGFRSSIESSDSRAKYEYITTHGTSNEDFFVGDSRIDFWKPGFPENMCLESNHFKNLGNGKFLQMPDNDSWFLSDLVFGALFSLSKKACMKLGGYDENFLGWGCEDSFMAAKAFAAGNKIIPVYVASGQHINHPSRNKDQQHDYDRNRVLFNKFLITQECGNYVDYILETKSRIIESFSRKAKNKSFLSIKESLSCKKHEKLIDHTNKLIATGRYKDALFVLLDNPNVDKNPMIMSNIGKSYLGLYNYKKAIKIFKTTSVVLDVDLVNLAKALAADGQFRLANVTIRRLMEINPQHPYLKYWYYFDVGQKIKQGVSHFNQQFYSTALRSFEAALIVEPYNSVALKYRDNCLSLILNKKINRLV